MDAMILRVIAALIVALPRIFEWALAPLGLLFLFLAFSTKTRLQASWGLTAVAALSMALISIPAIELAYLAWRFGRVAANLLLGLGPAQAMAFLGAILRGASFSALDLMVMVVTTLGASLAAVLVSREKVQA